MVKVVPIQLVGGLEKQKTKKITVTLNVVFNERVTTTVTQFFSYIRTNLICINSLGDIVKVTVQSWKFTTYLQSTCHKDPYSSYESLHGFYLVIY